MERASTLRTIVVGALVLTLAACGTPSGRPDPVVTATASASPAPDPAATLAAAVAKTAAVPMVLSLDSDAGAPVTVAYDPALGLASLKGGDLNLVITPDEIYADLAPTPRIVRMAIAKFKTTSPLLFYADPVAPLTLLTGATKVVGGRTLSGTIDLSTVSARTTGARRFLEYLVAGANNKAATFAFSATVDEAGYVSRFQATLPGIGDDGYDAIYQVTMSGFGISVSVTKPTGRQVVDAAPRAYTSG